MKALDLAELDIAPVDFQNTETLVRSESGARWDLPDETFMRWWRALPEEDRAEFVGIYGGDEVLARFVCALDYLTVMQARPQSGTTLVEAYAVASGLDPASETARVGATACWKHDAVQSLVDRLRYRSTRQAAARITNRATAVIEDMLAIAHGEEVELKDKSMAVTAALKFMKMVSEEDVQERVERTKRGFANARKELTVSEVEAPDPEQAKMYLTMLRDTLGQEEFDRAVKDI